jgi:3-oxoacyl-(acyl-carrier-protein) synthase
LAVFESWRSNTLSPSIELKGAYTASEDCSNAIGQNEGGDGFKAAIQGAMDCAEIEPWTIRTIKTHGTGTRSNNQAEKAAIESVFSDFVATSYKQRVGHTMGVSGLLESCVLLDDILKRKIVPGIPNRTEQDDVYLSHDIEAPEGSFLSLAAGMGNVYSAAVFTPRV